jgi:RNA recognition motif-containing protein
VSIFVGNLPFRAEQEDVVELFSPYGEVVNCSLPLERDTGRKRGFAFVEMADPEMESRAIEALQGAELMGRPLRINRAEPRGSGPRRPAGGGGGYAGGGGYGGGSGGGHGGGGPRGSGARGWEDRSYGSAAQEGGFEAGRTRRRRGAGGGGGFEGGFADEGGYPGAED